MGKVLIAMPITWQQGALLVVCAVALCAADAETAYRQVYELDELAEGEGVYADPPKAEAKEEPAVDQKSAAEAAKKKLESVAEEKAKEAAKEAKAEVEKKLEAKLEEKKAEIKLEKK